MTLICPPWTRCPPHFFPIPCAACQRVAMGVNSWEGQVVRFWSVLDQDLHRCNLLFELGSFGAPAYLLFACAKIGMVRMDLGLLGTGFKGSTVRGLGSSRVVCRLFTTPF